MREFKYYPEDFGKLKVKVHHMNLIFDVFDDHTIVDSKIKVTTVEEIKELTLDAKNLEMLQASAEHPCSHEYKKEEDKLILKFQNAVPKDTTFHINTKSKCIPTENILEGLYYDETPTGCPPTQITQCQQWGFQRMVPSFDAMTAKCTYHTTIKASAAYTNLLTNGDPISLEKIPNHRVQAEYDNTTTPMATYLFFLGVGTYATFSREFRYPDGDTCILELLVPRDSDPHVAEEALDVIADAVLWTHLFTGPDTYENEETSRRIWDAMKKEEYTLAKQLAEKLTLGYKYTGKVYREIGMQNSDFGGMENVGNTTITTNRIMPYPYMSDRAFQYMMRVKAHEFYHNLNGSEVTGFSPFEIWLNEAVTVFIENQNFAFNYGKDYERLSTVQDIIAPHGGTLAQDSMPTSMPIEPDGFNDPNELITGITYVKAPEFVRMIEQMMGAANFTKALHNYHTKFKHSNATWQQWIECMEEVGKRDFKTMARAWLKQTGYPTVKITKTFTEDKLTLHCSQTGFKTQPYIFPLRVALCDKEGQVIAEQIATIESESQDVVFEEVPEPAYVSLARGYSFYGEVEYAASTNELLLQAKTDHDVINRFMAFTKLFAQERLRMLKNPDAHLSEELITLYHDLLTDEDLTERLGSSHVALFDVVNDESCKYQYEALYQVGERMRKDIAKVHKDSLLKTYTHLKNKTYNGTPLQQRIDSIKDREVKNTALALLARLDTKEIQSLIKQQFVQSTNATDKLTAFILYLRSSAEDRMQVLKEYEAVAKQNLVTWESFLASVARNEAPDALDIIKEIETSDQFRITQANDQRALFAVFAHNRRKSLLTKEGRAYLKHAILKLAPINEYNTLHILEAFGVIHHLEDDVKQECVTLLKDVLEQLSEQKQPSVTSYIKRLLAV